MKMSKQDIIYSLLLLSAGFVVGFVVGNGAQNKKAEYTIEATQDNVIITETQTGKQKQVSHKELNDYFINDNL